MHQQPNSTYLSDYRAHLTDTQRHLLGIEDDNDDEDSVSWSTEEQSRFFHALAVHSRWRLDLVAACVGTKSIIDVSVYVKSLRDAAIALDAGTRKPGEDENERAGSQPSVNEVDESLSDVSSDQDACTIALARRRALPCAMTMSNRWIEMEEKQARVLAFVEPFWEAETVRRKRRAEEDEELGEGGTPREVKWAQEDTFARLGEANLRVMDSLIREAEEEEERGWSRKRKRGLEDDGANEQDENVNTQDLTMSPFARRRYMKRLYMRRKRAAVKGEPVAENVARLKPGRPFRPRVPRTGRHKQRRAKKGGEDEVETEGGDGNAAMDVPQNNEEADEQAPVDDRHRNVGGLTAHYRIKREFQQMGVEGDALRRDGYGLFHLGGIARTMKARSSNTISINASTLRLLYAAVIAYIREVIGRVIVLRAEEVRQKGGCKAWHTSTTEIRVRDVNAVVEGWDIDHHGLIAPETDEEEEGTEVDDVDSETEMCELEEDELLNREDCAEEERYERQLWTSTQISR